MSERSQIQKVISLFFEAINANDASIIPLADDVKMSGPMMMEPISGATAVRDYFNETAPFIARMDQKATVIEGENAAVIVEFEGLNGVCIEGARFFRVVDGMICSDQVFFDTRPLFKGAN